MASNSLVFLLPSRLVRRISRVFQIDMSSVDNWFKLFRWWQEHVKHRSGSSTVIDEHQRLLTRCPSSASTRSTKASQKLKMKKRASFSEVDDQQAACNDFRHVRDSVRGKNPLTTRVTPSNAAYKRSVD